MGANSKRLMGGPVLPVQVVLNTSSLRRVLRYERDDLTVSVEAGMPLSALQSLLAQNGQMLALDPPLSANATIGGVLATNGSGPMRRGFGSARDLVIGMTFATLDCKLVKTGGMVVKNVAGLDISKLMIGSFGTLAVITSANFRVHSLPRETRTFLSIHKNVDSTMLMRDSILRSSLQPIALDLLNVPAATRLGFNGYVLAVRAGGSARVLNRYARELTGVTDLSGREEEEFWSRVQEFSPDFLKRQRSGLVLRISTPIADVSTVVRLASDACVSRAGSGITYVHLTTWQTAMPLWTAGQERGWSIVVELASDDIRSTKDLWLQSKDESSATAFVMMEKIKKMFDPRQLLNRSRLYGRI